MKNIHSFHIPVMGTGFSIDTPIKVAQYGINSVISLVDDALVEEMRKHYCKLTDKEYIPISKFDDDFRAKRITAYLNLVDQIVKQKFESVKNSCFEVGSEITKYFEMLSDRSPLKTMYQKMLKANDPETKAKLQEELRSKMKPGNIDVNIMTKLDRANFTAKREALPAESSDALSALRGYAKSTLTSAIIFSAGINRRLYSYVEKFEDFYADATGFIKKKIILKVSDYRSSIIQGRFFAKKGIWISEYRVESGLNCGGHAFASDGFLMGPILDEFKIKKQELISSLHNIYNKALKLKERITFEEPREMSITAQGGIGTVREDRLITDHFEIDGTGWATPFLLVPEATNVDPTTLEKLCNADEKDLYLSDVSPLGVPFNNLRDNNSDSEKQRKVEIGRPGSACPKGHLVSNTEFTETAICTASRQYQKLKIEQMEKLNLSQAAFKMKYDHIVKKACLCNDLAEPPRINHGIDMNNVGHFTAICPGPNMAYYSKIATLREMVDHIYGRGNLLNGTYRPNMYIKELKAYIDYFKNEIKKNAIEPTEKQIAYFNEFKDNLFDGIAFYFKLFPKMVEESQEYCQMALAELQFFKNKLEKLMSDNMNVFGKNIPELNTVTA